METVPTGRGSSGKATLAPASPGGPGRQYRRLAVDFFPVPSPRNTSMVMLRMGIGRLCGCVLPLKAPLP